MTPHWKMLTTTRAEREHFSKGSTTVILYSKARKYKQERTGGLHRVMTKEIHETAAGALGTKKS